MKLVLVLQRDVKDPERLCKGKSLSFSSFLVQLFFILNTKYGKVPSFSEQQGLLTMFCLEKASGRVQDSEAGLEAPPQLPELGPGRHLSGDPCESASCEWQNITEWKVRETELL